MTVWNTTRHPIDLSRPRVMGIVNVTPDSFSDGGLHAGSASAIAHCEALLRDGADILDLGGESTRPGALPVDADVEWSRIEPVLRAALSLGCPVSVDTMKAEVMRRALDLGVDIINDVQALRAPGALAVVAPSRAGICLMHMLGEPRSMQLEPPRYGDVVESVGLFLRGRVQALLALGVDAGRIVLDPGIGFGKTVDDNFTLLARQRELLALGFPLLAGWSRKSSIGAITGRPADQRLAGSLAAALAALAQGASVVRVHDVAATVDAVKVWVAAGQWRPQADA